MGMLDKFKQQAIRHREAVERKEQEEAARKQAERDAKEDAKLLKALGAAQEVKQVRWGEDVVITEKAKYEGNPIADAKQITLPGFGWVFGRDVQLALNEDTVAFVRSKLDDDDHVELRCVVRGGGVVTHSVLAFALDAARKQYEENRAANSVSLGKVA